MSATVVAAAVSDAVDIAWASDALTTTPNPQIPFIPADIHLHNEKTKMSLLKG